MTYREEEKNYTIDMLNAIYKNAEKTVHLDRERYPEVTIRIDGKAVESINIGDDATPMETIALFNNYLVDMLCEFDYEPFDTYEELEDWVDSEINEVSVFEQISPNVWRVVGSVYNGHPEDHHYWEGVDGYFRVG